ncbi:MAG TPA: DUF397 domain-containing protein [Actinophytocola sp.]|jgi:hypothetical protein|nr:DUF397 domain-containing protein [Actinophytocola sp.]
MTTNRVIESPGDGWFVSSFSNGAGACVEVKFDATGTILVRDSKDRRQGRPIIGLPSRGWAALLGDISK